MGVRPILSVDLNDGLICSIVSQSIVEGGGERGGGEINDSINHL